jgi:hypothetical protein
MNRRVFRNRHEIRVSAAYDVHVLTASRACDGTVFAFLAASPPRRRANIYPVEKIFIGLRRKRLVALKNGFTHANQCK